MRPDRNVLVGVDGCKSGWIAAIDRESKISIAVFATITDLFGAIGEGALVAIDMPIGLNRRNGPGGRGPEQLVRPMLGVRQSSVFSVPARSAVEAADYANACILAARLSDPPRKVSKQCFHIFPKILELDRHLRAHPYLLRQTFEVHPELGFWRLNKCQPLTEPKKVKGAVHGPGMELRKALLRQGDIDATVLAACVPKGAGADDMLDALSALTVARRLANGTARCYPDPPGRDEYGLPSAIWV